ncbi:rhodanese-like domain-containing protein [Stackebrandtia nassauensis]|uniref:CMP/dCMP deaminase zinc-binding protein n=1 Tax=Stackebrandtia nassauensis (strain DSM 44728 / CIP 108903 / NRRL B-16338 / NBRC 102104 / LLR-40K-21) TaxID=446470 RepID=D3Q6F1_STANL|nr:rhodanese-like domain-containing protein [Stackebrandtia nassauensis]ADD44194.1 CMP/dCMP deaminase zinc-binding protein [Stackebrandtia nassauensis DSM 44728]
MADEHWLRQAIALAAKCPPSDTAFSVGAVIVADGRVLATGYSRETDPHDHAEEAALSKLDQDLSGATVYSSLEPCGQRASRPVSCAELIIAARVPRVVYAWREPDTFVQPKGLRLLAEARVELVQLSHLAEAAAAPNAHLLLSATMSPMPLMTAGQLRELLETQAPTVLDVRWSLAAGADRDGYQAGHLPGAVFLDLDADLCGPPGPGGRHPLPEPDALRAVLRSAGVTRTGPVVVYDGGDMLAAARTWWTLRWAGVQDVRVLDGGFAAWQAEGGPVTAETSDVAASDFDVTPGGLPELDSAAAAALARTGTLLDVRTPERYRGETEPIDPVAGHIPAAVNAPAGDTMAPDHGFRAPGELAETYRRFDGEVGVYCGSGVTAARTALAMTAAGLDTPAVYIGSWSHWVADPARPVALGDE